MRNKSYGRLSEQKTKEAESETLDDVVKNNIHVISLMATVSKNDLVFATGDKENFLVNNRGISILTCL